MTFQTGFFRVFDHRSQRAFTTAPSAKCMTPFSGPTQRSWLSEVRYRHVFLQSLVNESNDRPTIKGPKWSIAAQTKSFPRPIVKVKASCQTFATR